MFLSVVIPAYNEEANIPLILGELTARIEAEPFISDYEIIICDDHSSDGTFDAVAAFKSDKIRCIRLSRRSGSHAALRCGLANAWGDAVLCLSADGQDDPSTLGKMLQAWKNGAQIVWGVRISRDEALINKTFAVVFYKLLSLFVANENNIDLANADFYLLDRRVVDSLNACPERNTSLFGLIAWIGFRQAQVKYQRRERRHGQSKWNFSSKMRLALDWIFAFSGLPLKMITWLGFLIATAGFLYALFVIAFALTGKSVTGWASMMVLMLFIGGIQLIMIGMLGEYLWRNLDESRRRPLFFIEQATLTKK